MCTARIAATAVALLATLAIGPAGCPPQTDDPAGTSLSNLNVQFYEDATSATIAIVTDNAGPMVYTPTADAADTTSDGDSSDTDSGTGADDSSDSDDDDAPSADVSITGPSELQVGSTGTYTASASGTADINFTWDLLGTAASLSSTSGNSTSVTGASVGTVTLVVEARSSTLGNVLDTATHTISIEPGTEYVVWYDTADNCWDAPGLKVSTRDSFDDASAEGEKAVLQGGFTASQEAWDWICSAISSRKQHYWCGQHYNIGGSYYTLSSAHCDLSEIPTED